MLHYNTREPLTAFAFSRTPERMKGLTALLMLALLPGCSPAGSAAQESRVAAAQDVRAVVLADPGAPAAFFPKPDRPVAEIVSSVWNHPARRDEADETGQLVRALGIKAGMTIGDIGAGAGYHTTRLSPVVGPTGRIIAQDIQPDYLRDLARTVRGKGLSNVTLAVGEPHDPRLAPASLDLALMSHMYHEIEQPYAFLYNLVPALKPGARVAITDLDRATNQHGTPRELLRCELAAIGYRQLSVQTLQGDIGYLAVFAPPSDAERPQPQEIKPCRSRTLN
jgi:predicted methyltransferase